MKMNKYIFIDKYTYINKSIYTNKYIYSCKYIYTNKYIYINKYIHICKLCLCQLFLFIWKAATAFGATASICDINRLSCHVPALQCRSAFVISAFVMQIDICYSDISVGT